MYLSSVHYVLEIGSEYKTLKKTEKIHVLRIYILVSN
jgi:hypothetical protein